MVTSSYGPVWGIAAGEKMHEQVASTKHIGDDFDAAAKMRSARRAAHGIANVGYVRTPSPRLL